MDNRVSVFRETIIPMSTFSRSAFGVGFSLLNSENDRAHCLCALFGHGEPEPSPCSVFRRNLFSENAAVLVRCPAGLAMAVLPFSLDGDSRVLLVSDGFLEEGERFPAPSESLEPGLFRDFIDKSGPEIPRLSMHQVDLLVQFMESLGTLFPLLPNGSESAALEAAREDFWKQVESTYTLVGQSPAIDQLRKSIPSFSQSAEPVLIESEQGNGRHLVAAIIHRLGPRSEGPFVSEDISLLPEILHQGELFGPRENNRGGLLHRAAGGTIFLAGIGSLSAPAQKTLLSYIDGELNGTQPAKIVASTDRSLHDLVRKGLFRNDLHRRLSRLSLSIPPLRDRKEDIPLLARHLFDRLCLRTAGPAPSVESDTLASLQEYSWPGNVRELEGEIERALSLGGESVDLSHFSQPVQHTVHPPREEMTNLREAVGSLETEMIFRTLSETNWNKSKAARILGLSRLGLQKKIDRYGIDRRR